MPLWEKRLLVALAIYAAAIGCYLWSPYGVLIVLVPLVLGMILGAAARLPNWWPVGWAALPAGAFLLYGLLSWLAILGIGFLPAPIMIAVPAAGYALVSWLASPGFAWPKVGAGVLAIATIVPVFLNA
ncbi:hypothetical protein [Herbidospora cretacea]|uniref:hypothetical protein n=1 Tax=Herbidospora cretacea TaxID=28444 RepID=UPI0007743D5B|nr:hypothetical protein [Herbidospora cretacea]